MANSSTTWKKGQSGNPHGRPRRGNTLTAALRRRSNQKTDEGQTHKDALAEAMFDAAEAGNVAAANLIYERLDGKVEQPHEISGKGGGPVIIKVEYEDGMKDEDDDGDSAQE